MANRSVGKNTRPKKSNHTGWEAWKALGIRAIDRGQLVHFGLLSIGAIIAYKIKSEDWVRIAEAAFSSGFFAALGWVLFLGVSFGAGYIVKAQKNLYMNEMNRVCEQRNQLQQDKNGLNQSSGLETR